MRYLLILQGAPGSGKSTFLAQQGLLPWTVSSDALRLLYRGPEQSRAGHLATAVSADHQVWKTLVQMVETRMEAGDLTIVDATHTRRREVENYFELAQRYRYQGFVVSWRATPVEECLRRNAGRPELSRVPESAVLEMHKRLQEFSPPRWATVIEPEDLWRVLKDPVIDGSPYRRLHVIGDLQGCATPLRAYLKDGIKDDELYVFVGDLLDRGIENAEVMKLMLPLMRRPNVVVCEGNHERHLRRWAHGLAANAKMFEHRTRPQIEAAGISREEVAAMLSRMVDGVIVHWRGRRILVTHGGLSAMPQAGKMALIPSMQMVKGVGPHDFDVDKVFAANSPDDVIQIHGHRNESKHPTLAAPRSYNLEGRVEFGGDLRIVSFGPDGEPQITEIPNAIYDRRTAEDEDVDYRRRTNERIGALTVADMVSAMRANPYVTEKSLPGGLSSFNFSREAFKEGVWDAQTIRARGLFVNPQTMEVVARSYDKFFNLGETPATTPESLARNLKFPARVWVKENGFLGIVGFDKAADRVVYASKSTTEQEFAGWVREIIHDVVKVDAARLKSIVARGFSLVFEVIDPVNDPHIIKYHDRRVVLLDAVRNGVEFKPLPYKQLTGMGGHLGVPVKALHRELPDLSAFEGFIADATSERSYLVDGQHVEGFVIEDASGFMFKIKLPYYSLWKRLRSMADATFRGKEPRGVEALPPIGREFLLWLKGHRGLDGAGIVALREAFEKDRGTSAAFASDPGAP